MGFFGCGYTIWELGLADLGCSASLWGLQGVWTAGYGERYDGWCAAGSNARRTAVGYSREQETEEGCVMGRDLETASMEGNALGRFHNDDLASMILSRSKTLYHPRSHFSPGHEYAPTPVHSAIAPSS